MPRPDSAAGAAVPPAVPPRTTPAPRLVRARARPHATRRRPRSRPRGGPLLWAGARVRRWRRCCSPSRRWPGRFLVNPLQRPVHRRLRVPRVRGAGAAGEAGSIPAVESVPVRRHAVRRRHARRHLLSDVPAADAAAAPTPAMTWGFILHVFLAGLFTFGFLRAVGVALPWRARRRARVHAQRHRRVVLRLARPRRQAVRERAAAARAAAACIAACATAARGPGARSRSPSGSPC